MPNNTQAFVDFQLLKRNLLQGIELAMQGHTTMTACASRIDALGQRIASIFAEHHTKVIAILSGLQSSASPVNIIAELKALETSFNLQYLQLQSKILSENRQFTIVSNIMKTRHDTAKNSINNIR